MIQSDDETPSSPTPKPKDGRSHSSAANGKLGGIPPGTERSDRTTYDAPSLAQAAAETILAGDSFLSPRLGPLTQDDRQSLKRALKEPVETFQARVTSKLESLVDQTADLIAETLKEPIGSKTGFRADTLPSLMAIGIDKLQALSGRASSIGSVNTQINITVSRDQPRESVLANLGSLRSGKPVEQDAISV